MGAEVSWFLCTAKSFLYVSSYFCWFCVLGKMLYFLDALYFWSWIKGGSLSESVKDEKISEAVKDLAKMFNRFAMAKMYTFVDRLANATGKEVVLATIYEALRISRSAKEAGRALYEDEKTRVEPYVAKEESVDVILKKLDEDLIEGLELAKKIAVKALAY